jgi:hypothetical protein
MVDSPKHGGRVESIIKGGHPVFGVRWNLSIPSDEIDQIDLELELPANFNKFL